jgi:hypothetical protein
MISPPPLGLRFKGRFDSGVPAYAIDAHYARAPVAAITPGGKHTKMPVRLHPMCREGHTLALVPAKGDRTPALAAPMPTREGRDPAPAERRIKNTCVKEERRMRTEPE